MIQNVVLIMRMNREEMWGDIIRRKWEGLKQFYEVVTVVDVQCGSSYKRLREVDDIV